jgi:hypothetical protein
MGGIRLDARTKETHKTAASTIQGRQHPFILRNFTTHVLEMMHYSVLEISTFKQYSWLAAMNERSTRCQAIVHAKSQSTRTISDKIHDACHDASTARNYEIYGVGNSSRGAQDEPSVARRQGR